MLAFPAKKLAATMFIYVLFISVLWLLYRSQRSIHIGCMYCEVVCVNLWSCFDLLILNESGLWELIFWINKL